MCFVNHGTSTEYHVKAPESLYMQPATDKWTDLMSSEGFQNLPLDRKRF